MFNIRVIGKHETKRAKRAVENLTKLLEDLPLAHLALIGTLGVEFELERDSTVGGSTSCTSQIMLDLKDFSQFTYKRKRNISANQRFALHSLKEEVIHLLDSYLNWTFRRRWKKAARADLDERNTALRKLCKSQRKHDSSDTHEKLSLKKYLHDESLITRIMDYLQGNVMLAGELLPDLFAARDYLQDIGTPPDKAERRMRKAFPHTYDLAMEFETLVQEKAIQEAIQRHPHLATDHTTAMRAMVYTENGQLMIGASAIELASSR